jgi:hypothetical protein
MKFIVQPLGATMQEPAETVDVDPSGKNSTAQRVGSL